MNRHSKFKEAKSFFKNFIFHPNEIGAVAPTSSFTAHKIAENLKDNGKKYIIELGSGTGSLTQGLIEAGVDAERLICIEINQKFCEIFKEKLPNVKIICSDVNNLKSLISEEIYNNIGNIISTIPLLTISPEIKEMLMKNIKEVTASNVQYIQVSYSPISPVPYKKFNWKQKRIGIVWKNLPPISIFSYEDVK